MKNPETPMNLFTKEVTARLHTLRKDRCRLDDEAVSAKHALARAEDKAQDAKELLQQYRSAFCMFTPRNDQLNPPQYRKLVEKIEDIPSGTVVRVVYQTSGKYKVVTTDPEIPYLPDADIARAFQEPGTTVWAVDEELSVYNP